VVTPAGVSCGRVGRDAAGCVLTNGAGLGTARVPLGRRRAHRLRVAAATGPPRGRAVRRLSRRSPRRLLSHVLPRARRTRGVRAARRAIPDDAGRADPRSARRSRRVHRGRRTWAAFRTSSASRSRECACRVTRCCAGNGSGTSRASHSKIPRRFRQSRSPLPGLTTPKRSPAGGTRLHSPNACARLPCRRSALPAAIRPCLSTIVSATRCCTRCAAGAQTSSSFRCRTSSGGAIGSTPRPLSTRSTGRGGCRGRSTT